MQDELSLPRSPAHGWKDRQPRTAIELALAITMRVCRRDEIRMRKQLVELAADTADAASSVTPM